METNFFKAIAALQLEGDLQITIRQEHENMFVAALLNNDKCGDKAGKVIPPLILKGTAQEIDAGFFSNISAPLQTTSTLFINMASYMKAQDIAAQQSKMEQQRAGKETKAQDEKKKKYEAAIKKPEELAREGKFREAWAKYPEPLDHPEYADRIRKRKSELAAKFAPDMFAAAEAISDQSITTTPPQVLQEEDESDNNNIDNLDCDEENENTDY